MMLSCYRISQKPTPERVTVRLDVQMEEFAEGDAIEKKIKKQKMSIQTNSALSFTTLIELSYGRQLLQVEWQ